MQLSIITPALKCLLPGFAVLAEGDFVAGQGQALPGLNALQLHALEEPEPGLPWELRYGGQVTERVGESLNLRNTRSEVP